MIILATKSCSKDSISSRARDSRLLNELDSPAKHESDLNFLIFLDKSFSDLIDESDLYFLIFLHKSYLLSNRWIWHVFSYLFTQIFLLVRKKTWHWNTCSQWSEKAVVCQLLYQSHGVLIFWCAWIQYKKRTDRGKHPVVLYKGPN